MTDVHNDVLEDEEYDTILSEDIDFSGTLSFEKPLLIRGKLNGKIESQGLLVVDEDAQVEADIFASKVVIRGSVKGNVSASGKVEIALTGKLHGDVEAPEVYMESGCQFNGQCTMTGKKVPEQVI